MIPRPPPGSPDPPGPLVRLLETTLPRGVSGLSMVGDLLEEWHRREPGSWRMLWFLVTSSGLVARYTAVRVSARMRDLARAGADALRRGLRNPVQTGLTVLALGIGIAAPATMFSVVSGLTRDVDLEDPDRVVHVGRRFTPRVTGIAPFHWLWPGLREVETLDVVGLYSRDQVDLGGGEGYAQRLGVALVTPGVFEAFGSDAALGRTFGPDDAGGEGAPVVLAWELWRSRFGGDRAVLGSTVRLAGSPRTVVGVMPEGFGLPGGVDLWAPLDAEAASGAEVADYQAVGRLADGASVDALRRRVEALNTALRQQGEEIPPAGGLAAQLWRHSLISAEDRRMLSVMVLVVGFVLVIACADVLHLLLARALSRSRETAVRVALGAGRGRIVGDHLAEAAILSTLAGLVGLALTTAAVRVFEARTAGQLAYWMDVQVDLPVLLFGAALVALAALGTGLVPAVQSSRVEVGPMLRDGGRGGSAFRIGRLSRGLVVGEIALSCALLAMAAVMVRGAVTSLATEGEYATSTVLTARYELRPEAYDDESADAFHRRLVEELKSRPGVAEAAVTSHLPSLSSTRRRVEIEGSPVERPEDAPLTHMVSVSPSFLSTLESRPLRGRALTWADGLDGAGAVLVNEAFVRERLGDRDPLGVRLRLDPVGTTEGRSSPWRTVVGVVPALGVGPQGGSDRTGVYLPVSAEPTRRAAVMVRAAPGTDPLSLVPELRELVTRLDADLALWEIDTLAGHIEAFRAVETVFSALFLTFGLAGLLLAGVGLYGLLAFTVRERVRELGVRTALGATPLQILRTAVGAGLLQLGLGLAAGLGLAVLVAPLLGAALLGADSRDPVVYGVVAGILGLTGLVAAAMPARRALRTDVVEALRTE